MGKLTETNIIEGNGFRRPKFLDELTHATYLYDCVMEPNNILWLVFNDVNDVNDVYCKENFIIGVLYDNRNMTPTLKEIIDEHIHSGSHHYEFDRVYHRSDMVKRIIRYINDISDFNTDHYVIVRSYIMPLSAYEYLLEN